jgi:hypothetical protein
VKPAYKMQLAVLEKRNDLLKKESLHENRYYRFSTALLKAAALSIPEFNAQNPNGA